MAKISVKQVINLELPYGSLEVYDQMKDIISGKVASPKEDVEGSNSAELEWIPSQLVELAPPGELVEHPT